MDYIWQNRNWPAFTWDSAALLTPLGRARLAQGELLGRAKRLDLRLGGEARAGILAEETLKTAAIEGEQLDPAAVRSSVARRLGLREAGLPPASREVDGLVQVLLDATSGYDKPLTAGRLKGWHAALFPTGYSDLRRILAGSWRGAGPMRIVSGPVGREHVHFEAPPSAALPGLMAAFLRWWKTDSGLDGLLRAGLAHFYFVTIHPFEDGNGRLARALTDMALAADERLATRFYSLSSQIMTERKDYYAILERTSRSRDLDLTGWLAWFLGCFERALKSSEKVIGNVTAKADFWQRHARTGLNERQQKVLNRLLDAGPGGFEGALTTRKYVGMTRASRATAFREIDDLVSKHVLRQLPGKGRNVSYELIWPRTGSTSRET